MTKQCASAYASAVTAYKRQLITRALADHGGNVTRTAQSLGLQRTYLHRLVRQLGVKRGSARTEDHTEDVDECERCGEVFVDDGTDFSLSVQRMQHGCSGKLRIQES